VTGNGSVTHKPVTAPLGQRPAPVGGGLEDNLQLANSYFDQGEYNQSITHFNAAIKQAGGNALDPIAARLTQILAQPGGDRRYHRLLGDVYKKQGQFQAALAEYSKALGGPAAGAKR
jgi:predicted negative regulator of RcsB-dependent stress response